jgi:hypothetical protein
MGGLDVERARVSMMAGRDGVLYTNREQNNGVFDALGLARTSWDVDRVKTRTKHQSTK